MYRIRRGLVLLTFVASISSLAHAGDTHWRVIETSGQVELSSASGFVAASVSNDVNPGSVLRTGANGRAVIENNGDKITVAPNSVFELPAHNTSPMEQVKQTVGTALYDMVPRGVDRFRVETPYLAALIKGTVFTVSVNPQGAAVEVLRGVVQVTDGDGHGPTLVYPGQTATVMANAKGEVHLLGKPPASGPKGAEPGTPQQSADPKSTPAANPPGEATAQADEHGHELHIEHTIAPQAVAIGALTNGLITQIDASPGNSGHAKGDSFVQTASLTAGFSADGKGSAAGESDFALAGIGNADAGNGNDNGAANGGNNGNGLANGLSGLAGNALGNGGNGNGNAFGGSGNNGNGGGGLGGLGSGLANGLGGGIGGVASNGGGGGGGGGGSGLSLGLGNGGSNGSNGIPPGLTNIIPGNGNGNAGTNGNSGANGNGNGSKKH